MLSLHCWCRNFTGCLFWWRLLWLIFIVIILAIATRRILACRARLTAAGVILLCPKTRTFLLRYTACNALTVNTRLSRVLLSDFVGKKANSCKKAQFTALDAVVFRSYDGWKSTRVFSHWPNTRHTYYVLATTCTCLLCEENRGLYPCFVPTGVTKNIPRQSQFHSRNIAGWCRPAQIISAFLTRRRQSV